MKKYIIVLLLFSRFVLFGEIIPFEVYFDSKESTNSLVEIEVKVKDFVKVYGYQMFVQWDSTVLKFNSVSFVNKLFGNSLNYNSNIQNDILALAWSSVSQTNTLPDSSILFTIKFDIDSKFCDTTNITLIDKDPYRLSLVTYAQDDDDFESKIRFTPGKIKISGTDCEKECNGVKLYLEKVVAASGEEVCIKVKVDSFKNIGAMQFAVGWNKEVIECVGDQDNWAANQGASALSSIWGDSLYYYLMNSDSPLTLDDEETLIEICFKVSDDAIAGDYSILEFVDSLSFEITSSEGVSLEYCTIDGMISIGDTTSSVINVDKEKEVFTLYQNIPNPFRDITDVTFTIPESGMVKTTIYDFTGKLITENIGNFEKGMNFIRLNKYDFGNVDGVFYYKVEYKGYVAIKKMVLLKN